MNCDTTDHVDGVDRRSVLAAGAAGLSLSLSGCLDSVRSVVDMGGRGDQLSLTIATVPNDYDPESLRIAHHLEQNLQTAGVDAELVFRDPAEFLELILLERDFDLYVGPHPADYDPDFLYETLHSQFAERYSRYDGEDYESGWQNPFGYADGIVDGLLVDQRTTAVGADRESAVADLLERIAETKPFDPICRPIEARVANGDHLVDSSWEHGHLGTRHGYLGLELDDEDERLSALITDSRPTSNINPLSATNRERNTIIDLIYDSLGTVVVDDDGETTVEPWLASDWTVDEDDGRTTFRIELREACPFHDYDPEADATDETEDDDDTVENGADDELEDDDTDENGERPRGVVTAEDVRFTYRLLTDTSYTLLNGEGVDWPAPRYRGQVSAVGDPIDSIEVIDDYELEITVEGNQAVGERALTVPILPRHVWAAELNDRIDDAVDDYDAPQGRWGLVSSSAIPPVGSGPFRVVGQSRREHLTLERFDDDDDVKHFTLRDDIGDDDYLRPPGVEELRFEVDPGSDTSLTRVENGTAHITSSTLDASVINVARDNDGVEFVESPSWSFYHVGFNADRFARPARRAICSLIDKEWVIREVFHGFDNAAPLATPAPEWAPDGLRLDEDDPVDPETPFVGTDGEITDDDVAAAHQQFRNAGYATEDGYVLASDGD